MKDNRKGLAIAIIVLFIGATVVPSIGGNIKEDKEEIYSIPSGLIAYYSFNDCTAHDDSGNGNDGTNYGANCVPGYDVSAFEFINQDIVRFIPSSFDDTVTTYLRIESWVYWYDGNYDSIIFDARQSAQGLVLAVLESGKVMFRLIFPGGDQIILSTSTIPFNTWTHITAIFDYTSQTISILINNAEDNTISATAPYYNTGGDAAIGNNRWAPGDGQWAPFNGIIDELRIYDSYEAEAEATIEIKPDTLNLKSKRKWVTCYIELPDGYDVADININTILLNDVIPSDDHPTNTSDYDSDGIPDLMVKFDSRVVRSILDPGENVAITITGKLDDETQFEGIDYIRVI